jgi:hypothetical protein
MENLERYEALTHENDGDELETYNSFWFRLEIFLMVIMTGLLIGSMLEDKFFFVKNHKKVVIVMIAFLLYWVLTYLVCFLLSLVAYALLACTRHYRALHRAKLLYPALNHLLQVALLMYCFFQGIHFLRTGILRDYDFHQIFVVGMLLCCLLFVSKNFIWFFLMRNKNATQLVVIGDQLYKVKEGHEFNENKRKVMAMMDKMMDGQLVDSSDLKTVPWEEFSAEITRQDTSHDLT